jgi:hypothetical protein
MSKVCRICGEEKPLDLFHNNVRARDGKHTWCKKCYCAYQRARVKPPIDKEAKRAYDAKYRKREDVAARSLERATFNYATPLGRAKNICSNAKTRANEAGKEYNLSLDYVHALIALGYCQKSGIAFDLSRSNGSLANPFAPSIDRINNSRGYTNDNIQIVCTMFNLGKCDAVEIDFIAMCVAVAERYKDDPAVIARLAELRNARL